MKFITIICFSASLLIGCYRPYDVDNVGPVTIGQKPPAPQEEQIPDPPFEDAVWIYGYWNWAGTVYVWIPGYYMRRPRSNLYWYPGGYVRRGDGYIYVHGRWGAREYRPRHRYVHPHHYSSEGGGYLNLKKKR